MNKSMVLTVIAIIAAIGFAVPAQAKQGGCVKGAIVGGIAGHFAGHHGGLGAAAGCAYGMHERHKYSREEEGRSSSQQKSDVNKQHK
jgi:hypothetical protein